MVPVIAVVSLAATVIPASDAYRTIASEQFAHLTHSFGTATPVFRPGPSSFCRKCQQPAA
jgi:hypothetical protein